MSKKGLFIVVDGIDGCGKTTIGKHLAEMIGGQYIASLGHGPISAAIRQRYLEPNHEHDPAASLQFMLVAHLETYLDYVKPIIETGQSVIVDRWMWTTYAYNVHNLPLNAIQQTLFETMLRSRSPLSNIPDISLYCRVAQDIANQRIGIRGAENRLDNIDASKKLRILDGFEHIVDNASLYSNIMRCQGKVSPIIDCNLGQEQVLENATNTLLKAMEKFSQ